jgi:hypothetical protein
MRHAFGAIFAISLAGVAAIAATTAYLNSPLHIGPPASDKPATPTKLPPDDTGKPTEGSGDRSTKPADIPDAPPRGGATVPDAPKPDAPKPDASKPDASKPVADGQAPDDDKDDKDPYEGIAPEDLPPDLQYSADSSVSFPTNT